jgi:hypothetical protein
MTGRDCGGVLPFLLLVSALVACARPPIPVERNPGSHDPIKSYRVGLAQEATTGSVMVERQEDATYLHSFDLVREVAPTGIRVLPLGQTWLAKHLYKGPCSHGKFVLTTPTYFHSTIGVVVTEEGVIACLESILEVRPHRLFRTSGRTWETPGFVGKRVFHSKAPFMLEGERLRWQLIYGGRSSEEIFVTYRKYTGDFSGPSIEQEMRYSAERGSRFVFQTLELEVIEATQNSIVFRVWTAAPGY